MNITTSQQPIVQSVKITFETKIWQPDKAPSPDKLAQIAFTRWLLKNAITLPHPITPDGAVQVNLRRPKPCWAVLLQSDEPGIYYGAAGDFKRVLCWHSAEVPLSLDQRRHCIKSRNRAQQIRRRADRIARREIDTIQQLLAEAA